MKEVELLNNNMTPLHKLPILPGIRNEYTGEVLDVQTYRMRLDLDAYYGSQQYTLTAKQIMVLHAKLIQPLTVK